MTGEQRRLTLPERFGLFLDKNGVSPLWIVLYYIPLLAWGIFTAIWPEPISVVAPVMGQTFFVAWCWAHIPGTLVAMAGVGLRDNGNTPPRLMTDWALRRDFLGLMMQAAGHAAMCLVLLAYEYSVVVSALRGITGRATEYSGFALSAFVVGTWFLSVQAVHNYRKGSKLNLATP